MKKIIKIILVVIAAAAFLFGSFQIYMRVGHKGEISAETWNKQQGFNTNTIQTLTKEDGEDFKILLLSDVQLIGLTPWDDKAALELVDELITDIQPDLIMTTGDNSMMPFSDIMTKKFIRQMESYNIPWGVVLGNHDSEGRGDRAWFGNQYENAENCLFESGPSNIQGIGNYVVNIESEEGDTIYSLIMMDSNIEREYDNEEVYYDYIYPDQIEWYESVVAVQPDVPSMLIFHIPTPEFADTQTAWENGDTSTVNGFGENREMVCAPLENTGLFDKAKELGSTTHIFCGHDHINSLSVEYEGIRLTYSLKTGPTCYADDDMQGGTLVTITDYGDVITEHIYR